MRATSAPRRNVVSVPPTNLLRSAGNDVEFRCRASPSCALNYSRRVPASCSMSEGKKFCRPATCATKLRVCTGTPKLCCCAVRRNKSFFLILEIISLEIMPYVGSAVERWHFLSFTCLLWSTRIAALLFVCANAYRGKQRPRTPFTVRVTPSGSGTYTANEKLQC